MIINYAAKHRTLSGQNIHFFHVLQIVIESGYTALEIKEIFPEDMGQYTVVARNLGGEARTSARLDIEGLNLINGSVGVGPPSKPRFVEPLQNKEVQEGTRAHFKCHVVGYPEPQVIIAIALSIVIIIIIIISSRPRSYLNIFLYFAKKLDDTSY